MAISNNKALIHRMSSLALHGLSRDAWKDSKHLKEDLTDVVNVGYKMNMTDIQASMNSSTSKNK